MAGHQHVKWHRRLTDIFSAPEAPPIDHNQSQRCAKCNLERVSANPRTRERCRFCGKKTLTVTFWSQTDTMITDQQQNDVSYYKCANCHMGRPYLGGKRGNQWLGRCWACGEFGFIVLKLGVLGRLGQAVRSCCGNQECRKDRGFEPPGGPPRDCSACGWVTFTQEVAAI